MKIQELERRTGLERPNIRFYEQEGLLNTKTAEKQLTGIYGRGCGFAQENQAASPAGNEH